jgi:Galactose oxidase, central domain
MTDHDLEQRLRAWYRAEIDERETAPFQLRAELASFAQTAATTRRALVPGWRFPAMNRFAPLAVAATAVIVATIVGFALLTRPAPNIGPSPVPGPTHEATPQPTARAAAWTATGSMIERRVGHTATLLPDGRVLVAGGSISRSLASADSAELYDPRSGTWTVTGNMIHARVGHTATLLPDGRVLVAGGSSRDTGFRSDLVAPAELYDPRSGTWSATASMQGVRRDHTATLLSDGTVLVAGGSDDNGSLASAELYDPASGTWSTTTAKMHEARAGHTATLLPDGTVLVVGGYGRDGWATSAELYDPSSGSWTRTASIIQAKCGPAGATLLRDGRVLLICGHPVGSSEPRPTSAELYDPSSGRWTLTGNMQGNISLTATLLASGKVLVVMIESYGLPQVAELYDPSSGSWTRTASTEKARAGHTATLLPDGTVLVAGGSDDNGMLASAELYDPGS